MIKCILIAFYLLSLNFITTQAYCNLVTNGSFELGVYDNTDADSRVDIMLITPGMTNITGWIVTGSKGVHWLSYTDAATDGLYSVDLQGENPPGEYSSLWTEFSTEIGKTYALTFDAFTGNVINSASVSVGSLTNQFFNGAGPASGSSTIFEEYEYSFTAVDSISKLIFQVTATDGYGPVVDNICIEESSSVPEPATMILFGTGIVGLAAAGRRKKI